MAPEPVTPRLSAGKSIEVRRKKSIKYEITCPNVGCNESLDVTGLAVGLCIDCPNCDNTTWVPGFTIKWWFKTKNFIITIIVTIILSFLTSLLYDEYKDTFFNLINGTKFNKESKNGD